MVLSKRERYILIATLIAVGLLGLNQFVVTPLLDWRADDESNRDKLASEWSQAQSTMALQAVMGPRWQEMTRSGLKGDPAEAETQVLRAMRDSAEESGVSLSLLKPDRLTASARMPEIVFQATGTGTMESLVQLLLRIQNAAIPIKVTETQISARKEGTNDLAFQLHISTIYRPGQPRTRQCRQRRHRAVRRSRRRA